MTFAAFLLCAAASVSPASSPPIAAGSPAPHLLSLPPGAASPPAVIADVAWIAGDWTCEALGGVAEEFWQGPNAGAMLASFRMIRDGKPSFYELATISEENGSLVCRIAHFDVNLKQWEKEKDGGQVFRLVKIEGQTAWFDGITYSRRDDGGLDVWVLIHGKDGSTREALFPYQPVAAK